MALTNNQAVLSWIDEMAKMTQPDQIVWIDGSQEQIDALRAEACSTGELEKLNQELLPDCYLHRTAVNDVARVEDRTFICCEKKENAGPTNNWMDPKEMHEKLNKLYTGAMKGRTMYVIPYSMGVVGSPFAKYGIELTDSIYVVLNMCIMTRVGANVAALLDETFVKGLHAKADIDPENRYIVQFPEENTIMSVNSGYGGNVLLGKKCFALRIASYLGKNQGWMAEHMLILGIESPSGEIRYLAAAFPSACGKTNLAMLIPPAAYREKGWKVWCVGDDIAWIRVGEDGRLRLLRRGPRHQREVQPQRPAHHPAGHHLHQRGPQPGQQHRVVGGPGQESSRERCGLEGQPLERQDLHGEGRSPQQPLHRSRQELPLHLPRVRESQGRAPERHRLRRPPGQDRSPGLPGPRLGPRRVRRLHHGL